MFENRCILLSLAEPIVELDLKFLVLAWLQNLAGSFLRKGTRREIRITQRKPGTKLWLLRGQSRLNPGFQSSCVLGMVLLGNAYCIPVLYILQACASLTISVSKYFDCCCSCYIDCCVNSSFSESLNTLMICLSYLNFSEEVLFSLDRFNISTNPFSEF